MTPLQKKYDEAESDFITAKTKLIRARHSMRRLGFEATLESVNQENEINDDKKRLLIELSRACCRTANQIAEILSIL